ncbi:MAG: hypothetical protein J6U23_06880 [Clostridiales bacterium]|nr:hypothetical protein [Clostridiales bacterium]
MKKLISILMTCIFLISMAGCSPKNSAEKETTEPTNEPTSEQTEKAEETTTTETTPSPSPTPTPTPEPLEPRIELSGDSDEIVTITENSYYEGDTYIIYFMAGCEVPADCAVNIDEIIKDLEDFYGLSFDRNDYVTDSDWREYYCDGAFQNINTDLTKGDIIVIPDPGDGSIEWADNNEIMLFDCDLYRDGDFYDSMIHELAHLLRQKQGPYIGTILEEGIAVYATDQLCRGYNYPNWDLIQYIDYDNYLIAYDIAGLVADPEAEFISINDEPRDSDQFQYQYGVRLVAFLMEEYGPDVIAKISENAASHTFTEFGTNDEVFIQIIKESTSDDVFERFADWVPNGWYKYSAEYVDYMGRFGL